MSENEKKITDVEALTKSMEFVAGEILFSDEYWKTKKAKIYAMCEIWCDIHLPLLEKSGTSSLPHETTQELIPKLKTIYPQFDINEKNFAPLYNAFTKASLACLIRRQLVIAQKDPSKKEFADYILGYIPTVALPLLGDLSILTIMWQTVSYLNPLQIGNFLKGLEKVQDQIAVIKVTTLWCSMKGLKDGRNRSASLKKKNQSQNAERGKIYDEFDNFIEGKKSSSNERITKKELLDQFFKEKSQEILRCFKSQDHFERAYAHRHVDPNAARSPKLIMPKFPANIQRKVDAWFNGEEKTDK